MLIASNCYHLISACSFTYPSVQALEHLNWIYWYRPLLYGECVHTFFFDIPDKGLARSSPGMPKKHKTDTLSEENVK